MARGVPDLRRHRRRARGSPTSTGIEYVDLCLGDTGAMTGHALPAVTEAVADRAARRASPRCCRRRTRSGWASELARRFGLPLWQLAMSATDANRFVLRFARHLTGRPADRGDGLVLPRHRRRDARRARRRPASCRDRARSARRSTSPTTTAVVPFNDLDALDRRLAEGDVACLLMEPALTNIGIVLPDDGYLDGGPRDHPPARRAAGDRRDAHAVRRARWLHGGVGARARPARGRQADRRRHPAARRTA